jgi:hypothetical protein
MLGDEKVQFGKNGRRYRSNRPVYFNSNEFIGNQYLTEEAKAVGYAQGNTRRDSTIIKRGVASLIEGNTEHMLLATEDALLHLLIRYEPARRCIRSVVRARDSVGSSGSVAMTTPAKCWIFGTLLASCGDLDRCQDSASVLTYLQSKLTNSSDDGSDITLQVYLDDLAHLFDAPQPENVLGIASDQKSQLAAQELFSRLLWLSATYQAELLQRRLLSQASNMVDGRYQGLNGSIAEDGSGNETGSTQMVNGANATILLDQIQELYEATRRSQLLAESSRKSMARLYREFGSHNREGQMQPELQAKLSEELDMFVLNFQDENGADDGDANGGRSMESDMPYEDALEKMQEEWGDWYNDDYVWTPEDAAKANAAQMSMDAVQARMEASEEDSEEELAKELARIQEEWAEWLD